MSEITFHKDLLVVDHAKLNSMTQGELVALAKDTNGKAVKAAKQTLLHAGQTGFVLIALKEKIGHGQFMKQVESLTEIGHRTATNYMMIARHYGNVSNLRGVRDAIRFIKDASTEPKEPTPILTHPTPASSKSPLPMGAVHMDAEIVEHSPTTEPLGDEIEAQESQPQPDIISQETKIDDGILKLKADGMILPTILVMIPHLTKAEIQSLAEALKTRWL